MKNKLILLASIATILFVASCSSWTDPKANDYFELPSDAYYKALREYKKSDHQIAFGWFANWTAMGASLVNSLSGLPDSMDIVSLWSGWGPETIVGDKRADLEYVQKVKGIRVVGCTFAMNVGDSYTPEGVDKNEYWGWDDNDPVKQEAAIRKYAKAFVDSMYAAGLDGIDIDHEPNYGSPGKLSSHRDRMHIFISELGKYIGPKSDSGKLLIVDGEPQSLAPESGEYINFFIVQAYNCYGDSNLNGRLKTTVDNYKGVLSEEEVTNKYVVAENFESVFQALAGGVDYTDSDGNKMMSFEGMARWKPSNGFTKAGAGVYRIEAEYPSKPEYKWMRKAIQIMNPSK